MTVAKPVPEELRQAVLKLGEAGFRVIPDTISSPAIEIFEMASPVLQVTMKMWNSRMDFEEKKNDHNIQLEITERTIIEQPQYLGTILMDTIELLQKSNRRQFRGDISTETGTLFTGIDPTTGKGE